MAETGKKKIEETAKKVPKGGDSEGKKNESPGPAPMGGGDTEANQAAGSKVKAERDD